MSDYYMLYKSLDEVHVHSKAALLKLLEDGYKLRGRVSSGIIYDRIDTEDPDCIRVISKLAGIETNRNVYHLHLYVDQHPDGYIGMCITLFNGDKPISIEVTSSSILDPEYEARQEAARNILAAVFRRTDCFTHGESALMKRLRIQAERGEI